MGKDKDTVCNHCRCEFTSPEALKRHKANNYAECDGTMSEYDMGIINAKADNNGKAG